jgi:hypothetical protein
MSTTTPTQTLTPVPTSTWTPAPTPTIEQVHPELVTLCPENREVPLSELGMDPRFRLVVVPWTVETTGDEIGYSLIDPTNPIPRVVPLIPTGMINKSVFPYEISADGQWVEYSLKEKDNTESETVWISSLDGEQVWPISTDSEFSYGRWVSHQGILVYGPTEGDRKIINPFTMEERPIPQFPDDETDMKELVLPLFLVDGRAYQMYPTEDEWRLYDYDSQSSRGVFQWLTFNKISYSDLHFLGHGSGTYIAYVNRDYGFDISPELDLDGIAASHEYNQIMRAVMMPEAILPAYPGRIASTKLSMSLVSYDIFVDPDYVGFYWFYYEKMLVTDYCFNSSNTQGGSQLSPDDKFIAFTQEFYPVDWGSPVPKSITIINLETGYIAQIDDYEFVGWGWEDN